MKKNKLLTRIFLIFLILSQLILAQDNSPKHIDFFMSRIGSPNVDAHSVQGDLELHLNPNIFEGLYKINPSDGSLKPALAISHKWINDKIIEFNLRKGVTFHNGEKFDANSVKFSFERMKHVTNGFNWIKAIIPQYEKVEIINSHKVRIHFSSHNSIFLISSRFFIILPPKYIKKYGIEYFKKNPVGTGAFYVNKIQYKNDNIEKIYFKAYKKYWVEGIPKLESLTFNFNIDKKYTLNEVKDNKSIVIADVPIRSLLEVKKLGFDIQRKTQGLLGWLYFNLTKYKQNTPIANKKFRQMIFYAIDYEKIKKVVYRNHAKVNHQWAFPNMPGYVDELENYMYDIKKSKEIFNELGLKSGLELYMYSDDASLDEAKIIKISLEKLGINLKIDVLTEAENNCILTAKNNQNSKCHDKLKYYDFMIGDFGWGLPHNYVSHLHTFSQKSFASLMSEDDPTAKVSTEMFANAVSNFKNPDESWKQITKYEFERLGISGLFLKDTFYAKPKKLVFNVYGSYDFTNAYFEK